MVGHSGLRWGWTWPRPEPFRWGGWEYRHIAAKHGWALSDQLATQMALNLPPVGRRAMLIQYLGPEYPGLSGAICKRRVVVVPVPEYQGRAKEIINVRGEEVQSVP